MEFGVVNIFPPARAARDNMRLAERFGFDTFWVCDSHVIWNECYTLLGWLAGQLDSPTLKLGTMVTNPVTRDPLGARQRPCHAARRHRRSHPVRNRTR